MIDGSPVSECRKASVGYRYNKLKICLYPKAVRLGLVLSSLTRPGAMRMQDISSKAPPGRVGLFSHGYYMKTLSRLMVRMSGSPEFLGWQYVLRKAYKYGVKVPPVALRAKYRKFVNFSPNTENVKFLFIGGLHRSGTSIVYQLIRSHPDVSGIKNSTVPEDEGQHLQSVYRSDSRYGPLFAHHEEMHLTESSPLISHANTEKLVGEWGRYVDFNKKVIVEKSPSNILRMRFLQATFADTNFCVVVRHPIPAVMAVRKWTSESVAELIEHWLFAHRMMLMDSAYIRRIAWFRYEDFVTRPEECLNQIWRMLDLSGYNFKDTVKDKSQRYFEEWRATEPVESRTVERIQHIYADELAFFGYSLTAPYIEEPGASHVMTLGS